MNKSFGFSVRIFLLTGEPEGLRIVEKSNWTGVGLVFPRARFSEARKREEVKRTGIYILWGPGESSQLPRVYIGEGDIVLSRLEQHIKQKDFWTHAAVFTSKDQYLNKAHVKYLESRLVELAAGAKRAEVDNGNTPQPPSLSEADIADAEGFLADVLLCLPVIGVNFFEKATVEKSRSRDLFIKAKGIEAVGQDLPEGFVVKSGSQALKEEVPSIHHYMSELRQSLLENAVLKDEGEYYRFTQDYGFNSPSTAAGVILGRSANGRTEWKDKKGRTLKEIQEQSLK